VFIQYYHNFTDMFIYCEWEAVKTVYISLAYKILGFDSGECSDFWVVPPCQEKLRPMDRMATFITSVFIVKGCEFQLTDTQYEKAFFIKTL
jgi:hypothetical protein